MKYITLADMVGLRVESISDEQVVVTLISWGWEFPSESCKVTEDGKSFIFKDRIIDLSEIKKD